MLRKFTKTFVHKVMYSFARNVTQPENMETQLLKMATQVQILTYKLPQFPEIPPGTYDKLMVLPVSLPIFPYNTLVTQVHPLLWQYMEKQKIKHLGAFLVKDNHETHQLQPEEFKTLYLSDKPEEVKQDIQDLETLADQFHQNIVYEKSIIQSRHGQNPEIRVITSIDDIYPTGTICKASFQKLQEHGAEQIFLILKGIQRIQLIQTGFFDTRQKDKFIFHSKAQPIRDHAQQFANDAKYKDLLSKLLQVYSQIRQKIPINVPELLNNPTHPSTVDILCGFLCLTTFFNRADLIKLFLTLPIHDRLKLCLDYFERYTESLSQQWKSLENKTNLPASPQVQKKHMKEIYDFLKKQFASPESAPFVDKITKQLVGRSLPPNIQKLINDELAAISELSESHPDFNLKRNFIELLISLPFGVVSEDSFSIKQAEEILESSHYGMDEIKTRILEFLSVSKLKGSPSGKALLLVGPPGVGKTSIASTIAKCLNRKFVRVSLGGENDVAIIKGHRRTYMASYPGKIVQALKQAQVENPVILLDEIDKLGRSFRGSISDALLEVLDPAQNNSFIDNYLDVPVDLSKVLFICSANLADTISGPLYDRMEVIQLSGYTNEEKVKISQKHLVPDIIEETGLKPYYNKTFSEDLLYYIINYYCRESGVRSLRRTLQRLFEKLVIRVVKFQQNSDIGLDLDVQQKDLENLIGLPQFGDAARRVNIPGLGVGLAYNSYGGSLMYIEIVKMTYFDHKVAKKSDEEVVIEDAPKGGSGSLRITGQLGQTIKESCEIAYTHAKKLLSTKLDNNYLEHNKLHMHFPAGAVKKDGPSAGIAITTALISMALGKPLREKTAMTGEISLTGKVLRIGGLKEKVLAAKREGIENIIIPDGNRGDWEELPEGLKKGINFHLVEEYKQVMKVAFNLEI